MKEEEVKELWTGLYEASAQCCMHGANCAQGMECQVCFKAAMHAAGECLTRACMQYSKGELFLSGLNDLHFGVLQIILLGSYREH